MVQMKDGQGHLECSIGTPVIRPEMFDSNGVPQVFPVAHFCESAVVVNPPDIDRSSLENVRGRNNIAGFAYLGQQ